MIFVRNKKTGQYMMLFSNSHITLREHFLKDNLKSVFQEDAESIV